MSELSSLPPSNNSQPSVGSRGSLGRNVTLSFIALGCVMLVTYSSVYYCPWFVHKILKNPPTATTQLTDAQSSLEQRLDALNIKVAELEAQIQNNRNQESNTHTSDIRNDSPLAQDAVRKELSTLAAKVDVLDHAVQSSGTLTSLQIEEQKTLKETLLFFYLREVVLSGRNYESELKSLKEVARDNVELLALLDHLSASAQHGLISTNQLTEQLRGQEGTLLSSLKQKSAQTWKDKFLAELSSLVTIRPLHGGTGSGPQAAFYSIENKVMSDDLSGALLDFKALPEDTQSSLANWRLAVEARLSIEDTLKALADRLTTPAEKALP